MKACYLTPLAVIGALDLTAQAADQKDAIKLVKEAIAYGNANGKDKLFREVSMVNGKFHVTSENALYVLIYDANGVCVAHGFRVTLVGTNRSQVKDLSGKYYVQEMLKTAHEKGSGWVDYKFENPATKQLENKSTYVEKWGEFVVGCGIYKK